MSSILQNKEKSNNIILEGDAIFQYEKEDLNNKKIFPKEEEKLVLVGENFKKNIEDVNFEATKNILRIENFNKTTENKQTKKYLQKKTKNLIFERETTENIMKLAPETDDLFIKTNQIDSPIHKTIPKELLRSSSQKFYKTKSIATSFLKYFDNVFSEFFNIISFGKE